MTPKTCSQCGGYIEPSGRRTKFCSDSCSRSYFADQYQTSQWDRSPRVCEYSGVKFIPNSPNQKYAERHYAQLVNAEKRASELENGPRGFYVYAWYDGDECFYVGKGKEDRWTDPHTGYESGRVREEAEDFHAEIVMENLTEKQAFLVESALIAFANPSANVISGINPEKLVDKV